MNVLLQKSNILSMRKREALTGYLFTAPFLIGFAAFFILPFIISVANTFILNGSFAGFENYKSIFESMAFRLAAGNTLRFIGIGVPLIFVFSMLIALLLYRRFEGSSLFRSVFILPLILPVASVVMTAQIFLTDNGVLNTIMNVIGLPAGEWLTSDKAFGVLVFLYVWKNCGYNIVLFIAGLNSIPDSVYHAARLDGAGRFQSFFYITVPLMIPSFFLVFVFSIVNSFKSFREAYLLCGGYPHRSIYMLQHFMNNNFENLNYQRLSVASTAVFSIILLLVYLFFRLRQKAGDNEL